MLFAAAITAFGAIGVAQGESAGMLVFGIVFLLVAIAAGFYLSRGQGPTTAEVEARLAKERQEAKSKRRAANWAGFAAGLGRIGRPQPPTPVASRDAVAAAQINAIADPETARSLQSFQHLLYTQAITDQEYQTAKDRLFGVQPSDDAYAQIAKLAELHEAGILGDVEFAAAKARVLGL